MGEKEKFCCSFSAEMKEELDRHYRDDGSASRAKFVQNALRFYLAYLTTDGASTYLSPAIKSCIDGRLGMFEDRISKLLFKLAVETDMGMSIITACVKLDEEYLRAQRGRSVANVKRSNGQLSFESIVRSSEI